MTDVLASKTDPHVRNQVYTEIEDYDQDPVATCQHHTRCSATHCLHTKNGQQECYFGYPIPLQPPTVLVTEDNKLALLIARNGGMV